ncbi:hypothetical protein BG000_007040 [Podila horticola]|nr:hypothetical protein BG000_007040 [Podila horticola]
MDSPLKEIQETTETADEAKEEKEPKEEPSTDTHAHTLKTISLDHDAEMAEPMGNLSLEDNPSKSNMGPSLRVKFKNRVSHTLASIKSSSNLRDKAKTQDLAASLTSISSTPTSPTSYTSKVSEASHKSEDQLSTGSKNRSKTFWTFPRLDSKNRPTSVLMESKDDTMDMDKNRDAKDTQEIKTEDLDSDHSIDFILPADYEDYTQFAEYPLKKRKKMEAAFAANGTFPSSYSNKRRPNSVRASADAMKRFLTVQKESQEPQTKNKSKLKMQDGTETLSRSNGEHWRRSLLKSLHLGKGTNPSKSIPKADQILSTVQESAKDESPITRPTRSDSIQSIRSRSMATSTHPGLMATTVSRARGPGLRRETLEMAMRRRRQSSAARSNISDTDIPPFPRSSEFFGIDNYSTTNITHTFTSFTLELADMYAQDVMNNSATPGLFNFKRRMTRMTISSHLEPDTDQSFRGFDSDGDAISGYTGDADVSMDEIYVQPRTPTSPSGPSDSFSFGNKGKGPDLLTRRKLSCVDGDSDTISELPTLTIRTRDLKRPGSFGSRGLGSPNNNNNNNRVFTPRPVSGSSFETAEQEEQARSPRNQSSSLIRKTSRTSSVPHSPKSPTKKPMSIEEIASWKPRQTAPHPMASNQFQARPLVPALDTRKPAKNSTKGSGVSSSTTLVPSSRTPVSNILTQSGGFLMSPAPLDTIDESDSGLYHHQHQRGQGSSSSMGFRFQHAKGISGVSTLSAGSDYSEQTRFGDVAEFDPRHEFPPTTPVDMQGMDLEALLAKAEREHQLGWEDLMAQKKASQQQQQGQGAKITFQPLNQQPLSVLKNSSVAPLRSQNNNLGVNSVAFDLGPSDGDAGTGTGTGSDRSSRSKRVMKKKMSVIRLAGHGSVQGKREQDGVIRVSMSSA